MLKIHQQFFNFYKEQEYASLQGQNIAILTNDCKQKGSVEVFL